METQGKFEKDKSREIERPSQRGEEFGQYNTSGTLINEKYQFIVQYLFKIRINELKYAKKKKT